MQWGDGSSTAISAWSTPPTDLAAEVAGGCPRNLLFRIQWLEIELPLCAASPVDIPLLWSTSPSCATARACGASPS